jgi:hypothetical protein
MDTLHQAYYSAFGEPAPRLMPLPWLKLKQVLSGHQTGTLVYRLVLVGRAINKPTGWYDHLKKYHPCHK